MLLLCHSLSFEKKIFVVGMQRKNDEDVVRWWLKCFPKKIPSLCIAIIAMYCT